MLKEQAKQTDKINMAFGVCSNKQSLKLSNAKLSSVWIVSHTCNVRFYVLCTVAFLRTTNSKLFTWVQRKTSHIIEMTLESTSVSVCFRGISRLPSAFVFLRWFKLAHISIQLCTFHDGCKQGIDQQIFNRKSISRKITHPQSWELQAKLTGEKLKGWSNSREKTNSRLQSKFRNTSSKS